ncbi:MAG: hypothetical protein C4291_14265 [Candidatus Dadabacteria bacterium]
MKKISAFIIVFGLSAIITLVFIVNDILNRLLGLEMTSQDRFSVLGKVQAIESGIVTLKDPKGQVFRVAPSDNLKGVRVGDRVIERDVDGWSVSIKKIEDTSPDLYEVKVPLKSEENSLVNLGKGV